jgi:hypothetical protein
MSIQQAFESFMSEGFEDAVDSSTKASWGGSGYSVELFPTGSYRVLWNDSIGNLYDSPGVILPVPSLGDEEWDDDPAIRLYDGAEESMRDTFAEL